MAKTIHAYRRTAAFSVDFTPKGARVLTLVKFALNAAGDVVAEVANTTHAARLLDIPEAYREYEPEVDVALDAAPTSAEVREEAARVQRELEEKAARQVAAEKRAAELLATRTTMPRGSGIQPEVISLTGSKTITQSEVILAAQGKSGKSIAEWNELEDDEREALISNEVEHMQDAAEEEEELAAETLRLQMAEQEKRELEERAGRDAARFVLINGENKIDLKPMSDKELRAFAKDYQLTVPTGARGDQIRQFLVDALVQAPDGATQASAQGDAPATGTAA